MLSIFGSTSIHVLRSIQQLIFFAMMIALSLTLTQRSVNRLITIFLVCLPMKIVPPFIYSFQLNRDIAPLTDIEITPAIVFDKLMHLNPSKSSGPEGWLLLSLKEMAQQLCAPLCILFKKSL